MGQRVAGGYKGDADTDLVVRVLGALFFLAPLEPVEACEEIAQRARIVRCGGVYGLVGAEAFDAAGLEDQFGGVAGENAVEVEGDPQVLVVGVIGCGGTQHAAGREAQGDGFSDVGLVRGQEQ